ncbi:hypothetical protein FHG87_003472 [Trinorchestia longiramus]|nr:hypothetical protein FHG87_003472 [Trinorchestia longiramus]
MEETADIATEGTDARHFCQFHPVFPGKWKTVSASRIVGLKISKEQQQQRQQQQQISVENSRHGRGAEDKRTDPPLRRPRPREPCGPISSLNAYNPLDAFTGTANRGELS